jgi:hypothetical protein
MRSALGTAGTDWRELAWAFALNALWMSAAAAVFAQQFRTARIRGALLSIGD